jgi:hypothetical protein
MTDKSITSYRGRFILNFYSKKLGEYFGKTYQSKYISLDKTSKIGDIVRMDIKEEIILYFHADFSSK